MVRVEDNQNKEAPRVSTTMNKSKKEFLFQIDDDGEKSDDLSDNT